MGYRIYIGIVKKKDLDNHLSKSFGDSDDFYDKKFGDSDDDYDKKGDFFNNSAKIELFDETPIEQYNKIEGYEDEEYPPYVLTKKDFQTLLDFYKKFLMENFEKRETHFNLNIEDIDIKTELMNISLHFRYLKNYFKRLIIRNKNIDDSGLFFLDYFNLVRIYENWKNGDRAIITHG